MIRHTVAFTLGHDEGGEAERAFLEDARALGDIAGVRNFEQLRQVGLKAPYRFAFSMEFDDQDAYAAYNENPVHVAFVRDRWAVEVTDFLELDYVLL
jgi:quinol monooxygenase YgiN